MEELELQGLFYKVNFEWILLYALWPLLFHLSCLGRDLIYVCSLGSLGLCPVVDWLVTPV